MNCKKNPMQNKGLTILVFNKNYLLVNMLTKVITKTRFILIQLSLKYYREIGYIWYLQCEFQVVKNIFQLHVWYELNAN